MVHHQNQNGFTWKRTKETPCITGRCKFVTTKGQRGCRKYVSTKHSWFFYFDEKPDLSIFKDTLQVPVNKFPLTTTDDCTSSQTARAFPAFSVFRQIGQEFTQWLTGSGGGCKKERAAKQIGDVSNFSNFVAKTKRS